MFALIYILLFAVWLFVLNAKIVEGPEDPSHVPTDSEKQEKGFLEAAAEILQPKTGFSMTIPKKDGGAN